VNPKLLPKRIFLNIPKEIAFSFTIFFSLPELKISAFP
jgi:hypothetical protein